MVMIDLIASFFQGSHTGLRINIGTDRHHALQSARRRSSLPRQQECQIASHRIPRHPELLEPILRQLLEYCPNISDQPAIVQGWGQMLGPATVALIETQDVASGSPRLTCKA